MGTLGSVGAEVNDRSGKRPYRAAKREAAAAATRSAVLAAAHDLFTCDGFTQTTVTAIARRARVAVDTVYSSVGGKPALMRQLVENALSGTDQTIPAAERDYVAAVKAAATGVEKLTIYAAAITAIQARLAPLYLALAEAAATDTECRTLWQAIAARRAQNMLLLAADLRSTGELRADLTDSMVADIIWSLNSPEYYVLLVHQRHWTTHDFQAWLADVWTRSLLAS